MTWKNWKRWDRRWIIALTVASLTGALSGRWPGFLSSVPAPGAERAREADTSSQAKPLPGDIVAAADAQDVSLKGLAPGSAEAQEGQRQCVRQLGLPLEVKTAKAGIVFRLVPAGSFVMGSPSSEAGRISSEVQHEVTLTKAFYCGKFEVTRIRRNSCASVGA